MFLRIGQTYNDVGVWAECPDGRQPTIVCQGNGEGCPCWQETRRIGDRARKLGAIQLAGRPAATRDLNPLGEVGDDDDALLDKNYAIAHGGSHVMTFSRR